MQRETRRHRVHQEYEENHRIGESWNRARAKREERRMIADEEYREKDSVAEEEYGHGNYGES